MKKRTLSLMLAAAMVLGSLTGCGTGQKEESKETAAVTEAAKAGEDAAAAAAQEAGTQAEDGEKKVYAFVSKTAADPNCLTVLMSNGMILEFSHELGASLCVSQCGVRLYIGEYGICDSHLAQTVCDDMGVSVLIQE